MLKLLLPALLITAPAFAQYKLETVGEPPAELSPAVREALKSEGEKVLKGDGSVFCEIWLRKSTPSGPATTELGVSLTTIPHGALLGAIRFPDGGQDRRGLAVPAGVYTLRFSLYPPDGFHQGIAEQRDFLVMVPAADDKDPASTPSYNELIDMAKKVTGGHPATLSLWKDEAGHERSLVQEGDFDWILYTKVGDTPIGVIVVGMFMG